MKITARTLTVADLKPAPNELRIVQSLINTADRIHGTELLTTPRALAAWMTQQGLPSPRTELGAADVKRMVAVREALRSLAGGNVGRSVSAHAAERLDREAQDAHVRVRVDPSGATHFEPAGDDVDGVVGRLVAIVATARLDGTWPRLKACGAGKCQAAFYDFSPNRSGHWCSMRRCGGRSKSETYRRGPKYMPYRGL